MVKHTQPTVWLCVDVSSLVHSAVCWRLRRWVLLFWFLKRKRFCTQRQTFDIRGAALRRAGLLNRMMLWLNEMHWRRIWTRVADDRHVVQRNKEHCNYKESEVFLLTFMVRPALRSLWAALSAFTENNRRSPLQATLSASRLLLTMNPAACREQQPVDLSSLSWGNYMWYGVWVRAAPISRWRYYLWWTDIKVYSVHDSDLHTT